MRQPDASNASGREEPRNPPLHTGDSAASPRTRLRRHPERGDHRRAQIEAILDAALVCHVATLVDGAPAIIPTAFVRIGDFVYLHGSTANRVFRQIADGAPVCLEVTHLDAIVLARSAFHTSMNYRCVVAYGVGERVEDPNEKFEALQALVEHVCPGRSADARAPSPLELKQTLVVRVPIDEASAKLRTTPPADTEADQALPCWAGVIPLRLEPNTPKAAPDLRAGIELPDYVRDWKPKSGWLQAADEVEHG